MGRDMDFLAIMVVRAGTERAAGALHAGEGHELHDLSWDGGVCVYWSGVLRD